MTEATATTQTTEIASPPGKERSDNIESALAAARTMIEKDIEPTASNKMLMEQEEAKARKEARDEFSIKELAEAKLRGDIYQDEHKGLNYEQILSDLPSDAQKLIANLRKDYTRKTQEISRMRKSLDAERKTLLNSDFAKNIDVKANKEVIFDAWDEKSIEQRIEKEVAVRLREMITPLRDEYELQQSQIELDRFKSANPDLDTHKQEIGKMLIENENLSLQNAYYIVKGRHENTKAKALEEELSTYKSAAREYGLKVGGSSRGSRKNIPEMIKKQGSYAIYKWIEANKKSK